MRLAQLIADQTDDIANDWASWAQKEVASDATLSRPDVLDHFPSLLRELVTSLDRAAAGSNGYAKEAQYHAKARLDHGFALGEVVYEYRILRRVIFRRVLAAATDRDILDDLARLNEALDVATAEAVDRFSDLRDRQQRAHMEEASSFRERFIAIVSHDLRNPLNAIAMGASLILRREGTSAATGKLASRILRNAERMTRMISDLLDLTRGRLGGGIPIEPKRTDLASLTHGVIDTVTATHPDRHVEREARGDVSGEWDPDRIAQAISNLVGNALDHGDPQSPVRLALEGSGEHVTIRVHNAGPPIPTDELPHVFDAFRRAARARPTTGLGLGLFIVHEIVRAHGGDISVTSTEADGTTFTVTLPRRARQAPEQQPQEQLRQRQTPAQKVGRAP